MFKGLTYENQWDFHAKNQKSFTPVSTMAPLSQFSYRIPGN